jgi:predicted transcriptional regulator
MVDAWMVTGCDLPLFAACRRGDPDTSLASAHRLKSFRGGHCRAILEALREGAAGQTELAFRVGLLPHQVNKRLNDLKRLGLAEPTGRKVNGGAEREWRAT